LIELLIVVAIIAILAAIAVPNFLEAQVRAKIARARSEMRTLGTAMEIYYVDNDWYPLGWPAADFPLAALSTPIAYLSDTGMMEPFRMRGVDPTHDDFYQLSLRSKLNDAGTINLPGIGSGVADWWILVCRGPDLDRDGYSTILRDAQDAASAVPFVNSIYDATNGTVSNGNIYRSGGSGMNYGGRLVSSGT